MKSNALFFVKVFTIQLVLLVCMQGHIYAQSENTNPDFPEIIEATIDISETGAPVHDYVYGMFTELLSNIFDHGLWAEMLSDRKFFYAVDTTSQWVPENTRSFHRKWKPVGGPNVVTMDTKNSFVGEHTPLIQLDQDTERGLKQSGLSLKKGKSYSGRIILSGSKGATVKVSLIWGPGTNDRQTITITDITDEYETYPLNFVAGADTKDATLEITASGSGYFRVGTVSLMPADNVQGFRADLVELLKELNSGIYRWPGGNMLAGYDWRDGIGDIDKRPPRYDYAWDALESNDVGTDEFLDLCQILGIDPYMVVNIGFGDAYSAAQWVEYTNGSKETPMGKLRAQNGHPEPYDIKWWGVGNEMYGEWQLGHMSIEHYILKHKYFAEAMLDVDPSIKLIACGANPFETSTTARHHRKPLPDTLPYEFGSRQDWTGQMFMNALDDFDYMAEHLYPFTDQAFNVDSQEFQPVNDPIVDQVRRIPNRIKAIAESYNEYEKMVPELKDKNITFALDEWTGGGWDNGFLRTLCAAEGLNEIIRHSDIITMGGYTAVTSLVKFNGTDACYSSVGLLFDLYRHHLGTLPLEIAGNSPQVPVKGTVGVDKPKESSGSDTYPLDVIATLSEDRNTLSIAIVNPTEENQDLKLSIADGKFPKNAKRYQIAVPELKVTNVPGEDPAITIQESTVEQMPSTITVEPLSITLYEMKLK